MASRRVGSAVSTWGRPQLSLVFGRRLHGANGPFRSSTRETPEMHARFLAPDVAMMHTRFHIYGDVDESERTSIGIRVVRKLDGRSAVLDAGDAFGFDTGAISSRHSASAAAWPFALLAAVARAVRRIGTGLMAPPSC
jgi:hypothetical protein